MTQAILGSLFFASVGVALIVSPKDVLGGKRFAGALGSFVIAGLLFGSGCFATVEEGHDGVLIMEANSEEKAASVLLHLGASGNVRTTTLRAFDWAEAQDLIGSG